MEIELSTLTDDTVPDSSYTTSEDLGPNVFSDEEAADSYTVSDEDTFTDEGYVKETSDDDDDFYEDSDFDEE